MEKQNGPKQYISDVSAASPAGRAGVRRGDTLLTVNGEPVHDIVDYEYLSAADCLTLRLAGADGVEREIVVRKEEYEPLGLGFATGLMSRMRTCRNHCLFCFIDQMPQGVRTSLHVKDDDWRMSFIMGNYVSLTNVDEAEFRRILARHVSPLYVSLHASDPQTRVRMMKNPAAGEIMDRLSRLRDAGLRFHLQIVLCPGVNDGAILEGTLRDVERLVPAVQSLAIVPVGLTRFRDGLYPLSRCTPEDARGLIDQLAPRQEAWRKDCGTRLVFLSDEWYILAGRPLPPYEYYEDFPQIENGVGLLRLFEREFLEALSERQPLKKARAFTMAGGESASAFFGWMPERLRDYGISLTITAIRNEYFGGGVNVGGLVVGGDLTTQLKGRLKTDVLLIPRGMLREGEDVFLDGMTLVEAERALNVRILPVADGADMIEQMFRRTL